MLYLVWRHPHNGGPNGLPVVSSEITIEGNGATIESGIPGGFRILDVNNLGNLTLNDVTITGGGTDNYNSGGLVNLGGNVTINNSTTSHRFDSKSF